MRAAQGGHLGPCTLLPYWQGKRHASSTQPYAPCTLYLVPGMLMHVHLVPGTQHADAVHDTCHGTRRLARTSSRSPPWPTTSATRRACSTCCGRAMVGAKLQTAQHQRQGTGARPVGATRTPRNCVILPPNPRPPVPMIALACPQESFRTCITMFLCTMPGPQAP